MHTAGGGLEGWDGAVLLGGGGGACCGGGGGGACSGLTILLGGGGGVDWGGIDGGGALGLPFNGSLGRWVKFPVLCVKVLLKTEEKLRTVPILAA